MNNREIMTDDRGLMMNDCAIMTDDRALMMDDREWGCFGGVVKLVVLLTAKFAF